MVVSCLLIIKRHGKQGFGRIHTGRKSNLSSVWYDCFVVYNNKYVWTLKFLILHLKAYLSVLLNIKENKTTQTTPPPPPAEKKWTNRWLSHKPKIAGTSHKIICYRKVDNAETWKAIRSILALLSRMRKPSCLYTERALNVQKSFGLRQW